MGLPTVVLRAPSQALVSGLLARLLIASPPPGGLVLRTATQATSCLPALDVRSRYGKFDGTCLPEAVPPCGSRVRVIYYLPVFPDQASSP